MNGPCVFNNRIPEGEQIKPHCISTLQFCSLFAIQNIWERERERERLAHVGLAAHFYLKIGKAGICWKNTFPWEGIKARILIEMKMRGEQRKISKKIWIFYLIKIQNFMNFFFAFFLFFPLPSRGKRKWYT